MAVEGLRIAVKTSIGESKASMNRDILRELRCIAIKDYVKLFNSQYGYGPSYTDICRDCKINRAVAYQIVSLLVSRGTLTKIDGQHRTLRYVDKEGHNAGTAKAG